MDGPKPPLSIRAMTVENVPAVAALEAACFSTPWSLSSLKQELDNPLAVYRVAFWDEQAAGYAGMHHVVDEGYITNVAVFPTFRRRGVARGLLESLLCYGGKAGLRLITLEVRAGNHPALTLYRQLDFWEEGRRKSYYCNPTEDALILTRRLMKQGAVPLEDTGH